jgi:hypothetical protein
VGWASLSGRFRRQHKQGHLRNEQPKMRMQRLV